MAIIRVIYSIPDYKSTDIPLITFFHIHNLWDYRFPQRNRGRIISDPLQHYSIKRLDHILFCRQEGIFPSRCKSAFSKSCWPVVALTLEHTTIQTVCAFPQTTQPEIYIYFSPFLHPSVKPLARICGEHPGGLLQTWDMLYFPCGVFLSALCPFTIIHSGNRHIAVCILLV